MKPIFMIIGEKGSGKTSCLLQLINMLQDSGLTVGGFISMHDIENDTYSIKNITTGQIVTLMQRVGTFEQQPFHFKLFPDGMELGNNWINILIDHPQCIAVIDEIGSYELSGALWCKGFTQLVNSNLPLIFTCKIKYQEKIMEKWKIEPTAIFNPNDFSNLPKAFEQIDQLL